MPEGGQQAQEPLDGVFAKVPAQETRYVRLRQSQQRCRFYLLKPALADDPVDAGDELLP